jgi:hypothetical protein
MKFTTIRKPLKANEYIKMKSENPYVHQVFKYQNVKSLVLLYRDHAKNYKAKKTSPDTISFLRYVESFMRKHMDDVGVYHYRSYISEQPFGSLTGVTSLLKKTIKKIKNEVYND